jgi:hypothetical protein
MILHYFDAHGRGDAIRIMLTHAKQPFTYRRINVEVFLNQSLKV